MRAIVVWTLALVLMGCGGAAAPPGATLAASGAISGAAPTPTAAPTGTLQATEAPTPTASPTQEPTATPEPTPTPRPTRTAEDERVDDLIREGIDEFLTFSERMGDEDEPSVAEVFREARDWAESQLLRIGILDPSTCTTAGLGFYRESVELFRDGAQAFLDWLAAGATGEPGSAELMTEAGGKAAQAIQSLDASC